MKRYTVKGLADLSGVSVRTLHHYDRIGLLKPAEVGANGYRYYGREELLRLQQILFHRELELPLEAIGAVLAAPGFDRIEALRRHRRTLAARAGRYRRLVKTLDATLAAIEGDEAMEDKDLYQGFAPEKQAEYEEYLVDRYGEGMQDRIARSKTAMRSWSKAEMQAALDQGEAVEVEMAKALADGLPHDSQAVMDLMRRHHAWVGRFWGRIPEREAYVGLGRLYQDQPDFRARYDGRAAGLTDYLAAAMEAFAAKTL